MQIQDLEVVEFNLDALDILFDQLTIIVVLLVEIVKLVLVAARELLRGGCIDELERLVVVAGSLLGPRVYLVLMLQKHDQKLICVDFLFPRGTAHKYGGYCLVVDIFFLVLEDRFL